MDKSGYNIIWKMQDVKDHDTLWVFTDQDLIDIFLNGVDKSWYDEFLNDIVDDLVLGKDSSSNTGNSPIYRDFSNESYWSSSSTTMTTEEYEAYQQWSKDQKQDEPPKRPPVNFDFVFEPETDFGLTVTLIGDKLAITSEDLIVLDEIKQIFIKAGNICCDHYKKAHSGIIFHTYIFIIENQL